MPFLCQVSETNHLMIVHIIVSSVWVAEWPPSGKELPTRLTMFTICNFSYLRFWFLRLDLGSGFSSSLSLHTCCF